LTAEPTAESLAEPRRAGLALTFILITVTLDAIGIGLIFPVMPDLIGEVTGGDLSHAAIWGGLLATSYAVAEAVGVERSVSRTFREAPLFMGLFTALVAVGAGVALLPGNLIQLLINMQVLNGFIAPIVLVFILILANRRNVLGAAVNGPRFRVVATICVVVVAVLAAIVFVQTVAGWFGIG